MEEGESDKLGHLVPVSGTSSSAVDAEMSDVVVRYISVILMPT